jgi:hypothetical protein
MGTMGCENERFSQAIERYNVRRFVNYEYLEKGQKI